MPPASGPEVTAYPPAGLDRRFYALVLDRLVTWPLLALAAYAGYRLSWREGGFWPGVLLLVAGLVVVGSGVAVLLTLRGATPGKAALGLRVVGVDTGRPIGPGPALQRTAVLGAAGLPTLGLGLATLAQTAVLDPERRRRGWHDRLTDSIVVDVRPVAEPDPAVEDAPRQVVNLTALRLAPAAVAPAPAPPRHAARPEDIGPVARDADRGDLPEPRREPAAVRWRVSFDTGESLVVDGLVLVGRRPESGPGEQVRQLVPLTSEDMSLSKTHAQLHVRGDGALVVTDRGSTNGSALIRSGSGRELPAGQSATLLPGDVVRFGDRSMSVDRDG